jgi:hypothetical protein
VWINPHEAGRRVNEMSQAQAQNQDQEILVWKKDTWGSYGQHSNLYTFVIDIETREQTPIFKLVTVRHENRDSRKNYHRYTYVSKNELKKLTGKILKIVSDYKSSSRHVVTTSYKLVTESGELKDLEVKNGLRDEKGFFDEVMLPDGRKIKVRKDAIEIE